MEQSQLFSELKTALSGCDGVWADEAKTELAHNLLLDKLDKHDVAILTALLDNSVLKRHFFTQVGDAWVFKQQDFQFFLSQRKISHSYTRFKNRIGLTDGTRFLKDSTDIVLDFPFKDCVLSGGQSSEEREECYFERNSGIGSDRIGSDRIGSATAYTQKTRKRQEIFFNRILAFDELDRLFDRKSLAHFTRYTADGAQTIDSLKRHDDGTLAENLIIKGNNLIALHSLHAQFKGKVKLIYIDPPYNTGNDSFNYNDNFNHSTWLTFMKNRLEVARELLRDDGVIYVQLDYNEVHYFKILMDEIFGRENFQREIIWRIGWVSGYKTSVNNYIRNHDTILFYSKNNSQMCFYKKYISNNEFKEIIKYEKLKHLVPSKIQNKETLLEIIKEINFSCRPDKYPIEDIWNANEYDDLNSIAIVSFSGETVSKMLGTQELKGQKSEKLIKRIIESHTQPGDIVLDFHLGSGTTAAVAHKMGRQYIGVEQMDYIETIAVERLKKVIAGEQGGISKAVGWQGGGEFVYAEFAPFNETARQRILACENFDELSTFFNTLCQHYFLDHHVSVAQFTQLMTENDYKQLSLDEQKQMMIDMLDLNQLYINLSDQDDSQFDDSLSDEDKRLSLAFYGEKS